MAHLESASDSGRRRRRTRILRPTVDRLEPRSLPATFVVNSTLDDPDVNPGDGVARTAGGAVTLRAAVMEANALPGADVIQLPAGAFRITRTAPADEHSDALGDFDVFGPLRIEGAGADGTTIDAGGLSRIFDLHDGGSLVLRGVTVTGGQADRGGAIRLQGSGSLDLDRAVLDRNAASASGGAIAATDPGGAITIHESLLRNNSAGDAGGALSSAGRSVTITASTFVGNSAADGGALAASDGRFTISNSTFSGNSATATGGAVFAELATGTIESATFVANSALAGGAIWAGAAPMLRNVLIARNSATEGPDVLGSVISGGFNLVGNNAGSSGFGRAGDQVGTPTQPIDPRLSVLGDFGGPTPTHLPLPGSPALDAGQARSAADQRGTARPASGTDIGAVEARTFTLARLSGDFTARVGSPFPPIRVRFLEGDRGVPGVPITFAVVPGGPGGAWAGAPTAISDADGVATAPLLTAGNQSGEFRVRATIAGSVFIDIPLTVRPGPPATVEVNAAPAVRAGDEIQTVVALRDAFGNIADDFTGEIRLTTTDPRATSPTTVTFSAADRGVRRVPVTWRTAGTQELTARLGSVSGSTSIDVQPGSLNHIVIAAPPSIDETRPFAIDVSAFDTFGNRATNYSGQWHVSSDDPRGSIPSTVAITSDDGGTRTIAGLILRSPGQRTIRIEDRTAGVRAEVEVLVVNRGPESLVVSPSSPTVDEGEELILNGSFSNVDAADAHTMVIDWGDGSAETRQNLSAGETRFSARHRYTDEVAGGAAIVVRVMDVQGAVVESRLAVRVRNVAPTVSLGETGGAAVGRIGEPVELDGRVLDPGDDNWVGTVDYGDGSGPQPLRIGVNRGFRLQHVYTSEGTFTVVIRVQDDDGGASTMRERIAVLLPGAGAIRTAMIRPGEIGTIKTDTYGIEFENGSATTPAVFLAALVDRETLDRLPNNPIVDPDARVIAVDFRVLDADPASRLKIVLHYEPTGSPPVLHFVDPETGEFRSVQGSARFADSFVIDRDSRTVTVMLDGFTSSPTIRQLTGTLFTLTVPAPSVPAPPQPAAPSPQQGFFVQPNAIVSGDAAAGAGRSTAPTTNLSLTNDATITLSTSEGLRRGGSDSDNESTAPRLPALLQFLRNLYDIRQVIYEAFRMWLEHPAPLQAPAELPPPQIESPELWQIRLDQLPATEQAAEAPLTPGSSSPGVESAPSAAARSLLVEATAAVADHKPWWLADAAPAAPSADYDPIPLPQITSEPSGEERALAALTGLWIGGHALALAAPDVAEEQPADPRRARLRLQKKPNQ